ncbi:rRNA maturation RNase YbeY [Psychroflexus aestuariivivens]|uniref:rRNA maturation RNase YbeY n=1 Tax=Psychroflexus aestuariivivens TaxID=1795040 RepID=UPI000FD7465D|nr:rRNA maturation RNase YbeY [Psychroflexus aestuariivivens]
MEKTIDFYSTNDFSFNNESNYKKALQEVIESENFELESLTYIFCTDEYLLEINRDFLNHDTLTDIITFDYSEDQKISAEIYISTERVAENAKTYEVGFEQELQRVMVHGVLHCCGYKDKTENERQLMRAKENEKIKLFHVEQN